MAGAKAQGVYLCLLFALMAISSLSCSSYRVLDLKQDVMNLCKHQIAKNIGSPWNAKPHGDCCKKVRAVNVETICGEFTEEDKAKIDLWMWADVARRCGNALPVGFNCSGYIVPPRHHH